MKKFLLVCFLTFSAIGFGQTGLYLISEVNNTIYEFNGTNGFTQRRTVTDKTASNLAVTNNSSSLFRHSPISVNAVSPLYRDDIAAGYDVPANVWGLSTNTLNQVYGLNRSKELFRIDTTPQSLGAVTGDSFWTSSTISDDSFFDTLNNLYVIAHNAISPNPPSEAYVYRINTNVNLLIAERILTLSGTLPQYFDGFGSYNGKFYISEIIQDKNGQANVELDLYEINPSGAVSRIINDLILANVNINQTPGYFFNDLGNYPNYTPPPITCTQLYGIAGETRTVYTIDLATRALTVAGSGSTINFGNLALGPVPGDFTKKQFVVTRNNDTGAINTAPADRIPASFSQLSANWSLASGNNPIGIATHPFTGITYGIAGKVLSRWNGSGNATLVGTIKGDTFFTGGTVLNDLAIDKNGKLFCLVSSGTSVWLYRINPETLTALPIVPLSGTFPTDMPASNGNGFAYVGDYFYYSRISGSSTTIWRLDGLTGQSTSLGTVNVPLGDLASCSDITRVKGVVCNKPPQTTGTATGAPLGITSLGRAGAGGSDWPVTRTGAHLVLESKTKGLVLNRLTTAQISALAAPVEGMVVYDTTVNCLKINTTGTAAGWKCVQSQTCPDQ